MRVNYRCEEFISIDEIPEVYEITITKEFFDSVYLSYKFMLVTKKNYEGLLTVLNKLRITSTPPVINNIIILTSDMIFPSIKEENYIGFIESDFNKFVHMRYLDVNYHRK